MDNKNTNNQIIFISDQQVDNVLNKEHYHINTNNNDIIYDLTNYYSDTLSTKTIISADNISTNLTNSDNLSFFKTLSVDSFLCCFNLFCFSKKDKCILCDCSECHFCCNCGICTCCCNLCECRCVCSKCSVKPFSYCNHTCDYVLSFIFQKISSIL